MQQQTVYNIRITIVLLALIGLVALGGRHHQTPLKTTTFAAPLQANNVAWNTTTTRLDIVAGAENVPISVRLVNNDPLSQTITVSRSTIPTGWRVDVSPGPADSTSPYVLNMAGNATQDFNLFVSAPKTVLAGESFNFQLSATRFVTDTAAIFTIEVHVVEPTSTSTPIPNNPRVELYSSGDSAKSGTPGNVVTYKIKIRNPGTASGTYIISIPKSCGDKDQEPGCNETPSQSKFFLNANEEREFQVSVILPSNVEEGKILVTTVRAELEGNSSVSSELDLITTVAEAPTPTNTRTPTNTPTPGRICTDYYEGDDDMYSARRIELNLPQPKPASLRTKDDPDDRRAICPSGDEDWIKFGGIKDKVYTIDISEMASGIDVSLELFDEEGRSLAFNDDFFNRDSAAPNSSDLKPRINEWKAPADGTYYIRVRDSAGRGNIDMVYTIEVQSKSYGPTPMPIGEVCMDRFEPDGLPEQAHLIVSNERQENRSLCPAGDADWVMFFGKEGKNYFIQTDTSPYGPKDVNNAQAGADTILTLVDRDGVSLIDYNDDIYGSGKSFDSEIEFTPEKDGFYYVQVKNTGDIGTQFIRYDLLLVMCHAGQTNCSRTGETASYSVNTVQETNSTPNTTTAAVVSVPTEEFLLDDVSSVANTTVYQTETALAIIANMSSVSAAPVNPVVATAPAPTPTNTPEVLPTPTPIANADTHNNTEDDANLPLFSQQGFAQYAFWSIWQQSEQPVLDRRVVRSWIWGMTAFIARYEPYSNTTDGRRLVQYFDKGRMEINTPTNDPAAPWFVTFGLFAQEMINHRIQVGNDEFLSHNPADIVVVGDSNDEQAPTYASFEHVVDIPFPNVTGEMVLDTIDRDGTIGIYDGVRYPETQLTHYSEKTKHNIPEAFWLFMNQRSEVYNHGAYNINMLTKWQRMIGYPISEPYWVHIHHNGEPQDVLIQLFQRGVLAYNPHNPLAQRVEMIDIGRHYYQWRYGELLP